MKAAVVRETPDGFVDLIDDWQPRALGFGEALVDVEALGGRELKTLGKLVPGEREISDNPRARSSVLRVAQRTAE